MTSCMSFTVIFLPFCGPGMWGDRKEHFLTWKVSFCSVRITNSYLINPFLASVICLSLFKVSVSHSVQSRSCVRLFATPLTVARQASLFTISRSFLKLMFIYSVMPSNDLILCHLLFPPAFNLPASGSFPLSQFFTSGGQSIGASASTSVLPVNIQDWFPLGLSGLISLQSKGLSRVFSDTTVPKHQFFSTQFSLWSSSTFIRELKSVVLKYKILK